MAQITLILGGIKTGKTRFAQDQADSYDKRGEPVIYLATAQAFDEEMVDRITKHRADRPSHWITVEEPQKICEAYECHADGSGAVLLDCLTLWLTNMMTASLPPIANEDTLPDKDLVLKQITHELDRLCSAVRQGDKDLLIVSNMVENGLVSVYPFARMYQDLAGLSHQFLASRADRVYTLTAGIPLCIKGNN
jgi:adenosylcobinamide kinase / adenosylcobinamide-phosphate guanylyltransferase